MITAGEIGLGLKLDTKSFNRQMYSMANQAQGTAKDAFKGLGTTIGTIIGAAMSASFLKECLEMGSNLSEVQNVVDTTFGEMSSSVNSWAKNAMTQFGMSEVVAKQYVGTLGAMSKAYGFSGKQLEDMSEKIAGLSGDVASFYNLDTDVAFTKLKSIFTGETESLKDLGVVMTQTALDQYALNNGFGKTTAKMTEQEKVMLRYQFVMSRLSDAQGDFAKTSDGWANQTRVLKLRWDSLKASMGQSLIVALTPSIQALNLLLEKINNCAEAFLQFKGVASGQSNTVISSAMSTSEAVSQIGESAEESKKKLMELASYDQLNVVGQKTSDTSLSNTAAGLIGSSTPSSKDTTDYGNNVASKYIEAIKKAWNEADFTSFGTTLSTRIGKSLDSINWTKIKGNASKLGKSLATFLNGMFNKDTFGSVGTTVAQTLNTAIAFAFSYTDNFDFKNAGDSIAESINKFFDEFDFVKLAQTINNWAHGLADTIKEVIKGIEWKDVFKGIFEFANELDGDTIAILLGLRMLKGGGLGGLTGGSGGGMLSTGLSALSSGLITYKIGEKFGNWLGGKLSGDKELYGENDNIVQCVEKIGQYDADDWYGALLLIADKEDDLIRGLATKSWDFLKDSWDFLKYVGHEEVVELGNDVEHIVGGFVNDIVNGDIGEAISALSNSEAADKTWNAMLGVAEFEDEIIDGIGKLLFGSNEIRGVESSGITHSKARIEVTASGAETVDKLAFNWRSLTDKKAHVIASATGKPIIDALATDFKSVVSKTSKLSVSAVGQKTVSLLATDFRSIFSKNTKITASTVGQKSVETLVSGWNTLNNKVVTMSVKLPVWNDIKPKLTGLLNNGITLLNGFIANVNGANTATGGILGGMASTVISGLSLIPKLANGGYVKANAPRLVVVGDNKTQGEIVTPEDKMAAIVRRELQNQGTGNPVVYDVEIPVYMDGQVAYRAVKRVAQENKKQTGSTGLD